MDLKNKLLVLIFAVLATFINPNVFAQGHIIKKERPSYIRHIHEIVDQFTSDMSTYGLDCVGSGGSMPEDVVSIKVRLSACKHATISEARQLELIAVRRLADLVNSHERIRPFLREYPFGLDRIEVSISFQQPTGERFCDGSVDYVSSINGILYYAAYDEILNNIYDIASESIQEAIEKQQGENTL